MEMRRVSDRGQKKKKKAEQDARCNKRRRRRTANTVSHEDDSAEDAPSLFLSFHSSSHVSRCSLAVLFISLKAFEKSALGVWIDLLALAPMPQIQVRALRATSQQSLGSFSLTWKHPVGGRSLRTESASFVFRGGESLLALRRRVPSLPSSASRAKSQRASSGEPSARPSAHLGLLPRHLRVVFFGFGGLP
ncbi:hypothetical protein BESB_031130 [Besnoitia besnoiti]|uniref:Uncharacterized protein n=1 Tax=Besnoitia besnoiti TaxID=94643 RepID=A0A2A9LZU0_BESBE|nr:hypothetical protein BESB_031130 [Besnoitia besnoiti]PFH31239.1 hypothetical protein BESB_031130 [Besnoitia besnoiti]